MELFIDETFDTTIPVAPDSTLDTLCMIGENRAPLGERGDACCSCGVDFDNLSGGTCLSCTSASWRYLPTARTRKLSSV
jgi:hypothetical protein